MSHGSDDRGRESGSGARSLWEIPSLPFIFKPLETPHNPTGIPDALPFHLGLDMATGRLVQRSTPRLEAILTRAYADGSMITGLMEETGIGRQYAEDFLSVIVQGLGTSTLDDLRIVEIGCGTGYLLHRLQRLGADVRGIEPGPGAEQAASRYGLRVERGFFPDTDVGDAYDVALLHLLLEHVADPGGILQATAQIMRPGGRVFVAVQDEEPYIRSGELSLLFHEHYSYFTSRTLAGLIAEAGGSSVRVRRSNFTNLLIADYVVGSAASAPVVAPKDVALARGFRQRAEAATAAVWSLINSARADGGTIGLFVPGRAANMLAIRDDGLEGIRFFDDDIGLKGKYFPGMDIPVENREDLYRSPPSSLLIMSLSFGAKIRDSVRAGLRPDVEIRLLGDLLSAP